MSTQKIKPIPVKRIPGKVSVKEITFNIETKKIVDDTTANIKQSIIRKDSAQPIDSTYTINYLKPYVSPEAIKIFYESNVHLYRCVKMLELCIFKIGSSVTPIDETVTEYSNDPEYLKLYNFVNGVCNDVGETYEDVIGGWGNDYKAFGNGYLEVVTTNSGELAELYNLRAYNTRIAYDNRFNKFKNAITFLQLLKNREAKRFRLLGSDRENMNEVLWIRNYNPFDRLYGFPEAYPAVPDLALDKSQKEFNLKEFTNDMLISFVIIVEGGELASDDMTAIQNFLAANYKGVENANKALVLSTDTPDVKINIEKLSKDNRDSSYDKLYDRCRDAVMISFGVLAPLLGVKTPGSLGNASELEVLFKFFNETVVKPEKRKAQMILGSLFAAKMGITRFKYELNELTYEKFIDMVTYARDLVQAGLLDDNEGRVYLGYKPRKDDGENYNKIEKALRDIQVIQKRLEGYLA